MDMDLSMEYGHQWRSMMEVLSSAMLCSFCGAQIILFVYCSPGNISPFCSRFIGHTSQAGQRGHTCFNSYICISQENVDLYRCECVRCPSGMVSRCGFPPFDSDERAIIVVLHCSPSQYPSQLKFTLCNCRHQLTSLTAEVIQCCPSNRPL